MADNKRVKLGKALRFSNQELDELAEITEEDIRRTNKAWRKRSHKWAGNILVAKNENA